MSAGAGIGLFICIVVIVIFGIAEKYYVDRSIECLKTRVDHLDNLNVFYHSLDRSYHSLDNRCDGMIDIIKKQQEEIKILKGMIEPKAEKKCCCGNCRFYYELNKQDSACLNVNVNNRHKTETTLYADNRSVSCGTIKRVKPNDCCKWYKQKEASDESD